MEAMEGSATYAGQAAQGPSQAGVVKSWNGAKGYGFISSDGLVGDIMFSKRELPPDVQEVQGKFLEGRPVAFDALTTPDGRLKATAVQVLVVEGKPLPGCVKSWSDRNGYGFITSSALTEDVRFDRMDIQQLPAGVNLVGALITFGFKTRPDGKLLAQGLQFQSGQTAALRLQGAQPGADPHGPQMVPAIYPAPRGPHRGVGRGPDQGPAPLLPEVTGIVKSYSERNRYGFITVPGQQGDIKFGQFDLADPSCVPQPGTQVSFALAIAADCRVQAKAVRLAGGAAHGPHGPHGPPGPGGGQPAKRPRIMPSGVPTPPPAASQGGWDASGEASPNGGGSVPTGQHITGVVKSFSVLKGFGFITSDEVPTDIYFGAAVLSPEVQQFLGQLVGRAVRCQLATAPDGKLRCQDIQLI